MGIPTAKDIYNYDEQPQQSLVPRRSQEHQIEVVEVPTGIVPADNIAGKLGGYWIGGFGVTDYGVVISEDVNKSEWDNFVASMSKMEVASDWMKADLAQFALSHLGMDIEAVAAILKLTPSTVESYASISRNADELIRINCPSLTHFRLVSALDFGKQMMWMKRAKDGGWSVGRLKKEMLKEAPVKTVKQLSKRELGSAVSTIKAEFKAHVRNAKKLPQMQRSELANSLRQMADELDSND